jgi:ribosomal protein S18 acetylase RimI-like enzyme
MNSCGRQLNSTLPRGFMADEHNRQNHPNFEAGLVKFEIVRASTFSLGELTEIYNATRSDYLIPMQMTPEEFEDYLTIYDVKVEHSFAAVVARQVLAIGMLGIRPGMGWVTRLGVLPGGRKRGVGEAILRRLMAESQALGLRATVLEVIKANPPARNLFTKTGYKETRELLVLKRSPAVRYPPDGCEVEWLDQPGSLAILNAYDYPLPWTNHPATYSHHSDMQGIRIKRADACGWLVFRQHGGTISHLVFNTVAGSSQETARCLLAHLYHRYAGAHTSLENIAIDDPHVPILFEFEFIEAFRRIEMVYQNDGFSD